MQGKSDNGEIYRKENRYRCTKGLKVQFIKGGLLLSCISIKRESMVPIWYHPQGAAISGHFLISIPCLLKAFYTHTCNMDCLWEQDESFNWDFCMTKPAECLRKNSNNFACVFVYANLSTSAERHKTCSHKARSWLWTFRTSSSFYTCTTLFLTSASDLPSANNHPLPPVCFLIGLFYWKDFKNRKENREEENDLLNPFHCFNRQLRLHLLMQK